jgi:hypothetical protein
MVIMITNSDLLAAYWHLIFILNAVVVVVVFVLVDLYSCDDVGVDLCTVMAR